MKHMTFEGTLCYEILPDETSKLIELFKQQEKSNPTPQLIVQLDTTDRELLPYDELYKKMKDYESKLRNIRGYRECAYSLNNLCSLIDYETKDLQ